MPDVRHPAALDTWDPMDTALEVRDAMDALRRIVRVLRVSGRAAERDRAISGAQLFVLQQLEESPAASLRELAIRTATDQSSVSVVVSRLVARGLVSRKTGRGDARRAELAITAAGRALTRRSPASAPGRLRDELLALPARVRAPLARGLTMLAARLEDAHGAPPMFFEESPTRRRRMSNAR
jgi:DNA-binding MarR family transcriptional regulator